MKSITRYLYILLALFLVPLKAQINVVVAEFRNESQAIFLDAWERSVPDLLQAELSRLPDIVILEREKLEAIFEEQRLALAGFIQDSALVRQIGNLAGADVIISGSIYSFGSNTRIDVNMTRVKTTEVRTEKAEAPDSKHLKEMIDLLANNIGYHLTGSGHYEERRSISAYPTRYFFAGALALGVAAAVANNNYRDNLDQYKKTTELDKFDTYYNRANDAKKLTTILIGSSLAALGGTLFCFIKNRTTDDITAHTQNQELSILPSIEFNREQEVCFNVQILF